MRSQGVVRLNRFRDEIGPLRDDARVEVLTVITVGPAIESTVLNGRHIVGDEVRAEFIAFVDHRPERAGFWLEAEAVWVSEPTCEDAPATRRTIDFPNCCTILFGFKTVFDNIAVGANADI